MNYTDIIKKDFEHMADENSIILLGDSLDLMKNMDTNSIDLIFADEPYNIGKDFGNNKDTWESKSDYISWNQSWISEAMRILKDNGTIYLMTATQFMPYIDVFVQENYHVLSRIIWSYDSSGVQSKKIYGSLYEPILMFTKTKKSKITFNGQDILVEAKTGARRGLIDYRKNPPAPYNTTKIPGNVWEFSRVRFKMDEYENHPTQKPEALMERIIKASSNENDIIFDPFGGSFTTAAVAKKLGRKSISIDLNPDYYKIGLRRLQLTDTYYGEELTKIKKRKTKNKSKKDHQSNQVTIVEEEAD